MGWAVAQLPSLGQLDGVFALQLLIEQHNAGLGLVVLPEQDLLQVFAVEILQSVGEQSEMGLASPLTPRLEQGSRVIAHNCPIFH